MTPEDIAVNAIIKKIRAVHLTNRVKTEGGLSGTYSSTFKGNGLVFDSLRPYAFGDDIRSIDWNSTAKLNKPVVKVFCEERDLTLLVVMDISGSVACGTGISKRQFATEIGATLAFSALKNRDRVGLCLCSDHIETFISPKRNPNQLYTFIHEGLFFQAQHQQTDLVSSLQALMHLLKKRSIICVLSDFIQPASADQDKLFKTLRRIKQKHDLLCIRLEDPREQTLPNVGFIALEDAETQQTLYVDTNNAHTRAIYEQHQKAQWQAFEKVSQSYGIRMLTLTNQQPYINALNLFVQRKS